MRVSIHLYSQSYPIFYEDIVNAYTKDGLYCVLLANGDVHKFPIQHVFRILEEA